jgi:hypothetical protein
MFSASPRDFDIHALHAALDAERLARSLHWRQLADQISRPFHRLPGGRISASTLTGMPARRALEGDGVLQVLRWLGRSPESFVPGHPAPWSARLALPMVGDGQILRFDTPTLHDALDAARVARGMTWPEVARAIGGITPANLAGLARGGRTSFPQVTSMTGWLERTTADFTRVTES